MSKWASVTKILSIPLSLFSLIIHLLTKENPNISDISFKFSTKYLGGLFLTIASIYSGTTRLTRREPMICHANTDELSNIYQNYLPLDDSSFTNNDPKAIYAAINDYCWNSGTFLVEKGLRSKYQHKVTYPGIIGYKPEKDHLIWLDYYRWVEYILYGIAFGLCVPFYAWKITANKKIKPLVEPDISHEQRVARFIASIPFNSSFARSYFLICKLSGSFLPVLSFGVLEWCIGNAFWAYGFDVFMYHLNYSSNPWPSPMQMLFPKMVKCEFNRFGFSGDIETMSIQCELPLNNVTGPALLIGWLALVFVTVWNFFSIILVLVMVLPCRRNSRYRSLVEQICKNELEEAMASEPNATALAYGKLSPRDFLKVDLGVGDWLVLGLIKQNTSDSDFMEFIRELTTTQNSILEIVYQPHYHGRRAFYEGQDDDNRLNVPQPRPILRDSRDIAMEGENSDINHGSIVPNLCNDSLTIGQESQIQAAGLNKEVQIGFTLKNEMQKQPAYHQVNKTLKTPTGVTKPMKADDDKKQSEIQDIGPQVNDQHNNSNNDNDIMYGYKKNPNNKAKKDPKTQTKLDNLRWDKW